MATNEPVMMTGSVVMNREVAAGQFLTSIKVAAAFPAPVPGQFVMLKAAPGFDPLLGRPFSIHGFAGGADHAVVEIFYRVVGKGTGLLASLLPGAMVSVVGPLGQGFRIPAERKNVVIIAGGMGIAPLAFLARHLNLTRQAASRGETGRRIVCYTGAATRECLAGLEKMKVCCEDVRISTDDGSGGFHGHVIDLFRRDLAFYDPDDTALYACGPVPMLRELAKIMEGNDIFCQVSLEERMACGLGACLGCAVAVKGGKGAYQRACQDGPVFNIRDVVWRC